MTRLRWFDGAMDPRAWFDETLPVLADTPEPPAPTPGDRARPRMAAGRVKVAELVLPRSGPSAARAGARSRTITLALARSPRGARSSSSLIRR